MAFSKKKKKVGFSFKNIFGNKSFDESFYEDLEDLLIEGDVGVSTTVEIVDKLRVLVSKEKSVDEKRFYEILREVLKDAICFEDSNREFSIDDDRMNVFLVLGVNGVGKTTTIAKMAKFFDDRFNCKLDDTVFAAGDTFRAAAIDQLKLHGDRLGVRVVAQNSGSDPAAVIYDAVDSAIAKNSKIVIADTAGRMHNKSNLVAQLVKINKIIDSKIGDCNYKKLLVIDATTGQNGVNQAEVFNDAVGIDGIILTKYDSLSKGGNIITISKKLNIPIFFVGTGEKYEDFDFFDVDKFLDRILEA